jgi:hypothetical protein
MTATLSSNRDMVWCLSVGTACIGFSDGGGGGVDGFDLVASMVIEVGSVDG